MIGRLADMFGRKNLYGSGFAVFTLGSFLSGLSQPQFHGWYLVGYRLVRGIGGSLLFTNSAAIVTDAFRTGRIGLGLGVNKIIFAAGFPLGIFGTLWGMRRLRGPVSCLKPSNSIGWDSSPSPLA
jgi:MFS family permease